MEKWQESRNYRRIKNENGEVIANIITVDGVDVEVTEEVYLAYSQMDRRERYLTEDAPSGKLLSLDQMKDDGVQLDYVGTDATPSAEDSFLETEDAGETEKLADMLLGALICVPGETGDGLDEDLVDESSAAVRHHALEVLPLCGGGAGDALVGVDIHHAPLSLAGDQLGVVAVLRREGVELVIGVRTDTGIGRYPQPCVFRLLRRLDLDDAGLHCQCRCAVCQMLFRHACSPPFLQHKHYHNLVQKATER